MYLKNILTCMEGFIWEYGEKAIRKKNPANVPETGFGPMKRICMEEILVINRMILQHVRVEWWIRIDIPTRVPKK